MAGSVRIVGLDKLTANLKKYSESIQKETDMELTAAAVEIRDLAKRLAPVREARLRGSIVADTSKKFKKEVSANVFYAPYIEFGTGQFAANYVPSLRPELQDYAMSFFKTGKGRTKQQPFFFPAFDIVSIQLIKRIENVLEL